MALRTVIDHPKFEDLRAALDTPRCDTLGVLETLWHFGARYAPSGDVGKFKDTQILAWLGWKVERGNLIEALVQTGWLDRDERHRLIIHDWHEHADAQVHTELAKKTLLFANGAWPKLDKTYFNSETRKRIKAEYEKKYPSGGHKGDKSPIGVHIGGVFGGLNGEKPGDEGDKSTPIHIPHSSIPHSSIPHSSIPHSNIPGTGIDDVFQDLPEQLNTSAFKSSWLLWEKYLKENHMKPMQPMSRSPAWAELLERATVGKESEFAISTIRQAMAGGWKNLYPQEERKHGNGKQRRPSDTAPGGGRRDDAKKATRTI